MYNELSAADLAKLSQSISGSKSFGPLTINYNIDFSIPQITASATLFGVSIGAININPQNPTATLGGSVGFGKAEVTLTADFAKKQLLYSIDVEVFGKTIFSGSGVLFSWASLNAGMMQGPSLSKGAILAQLQKEGVTNLDQFADMLLQKVHKDGNPNGPVVNSAIVYEHGFVSH